jgi:hypothetical protein
MASFRHSRFLPLSVARTRQNPGLTRTTRNEYDAAGRLTKTTAVCGAKRSPKPSERAKRENTKQTHFLPQPAQNKTKHITRVRGVGTQPAADHHPDTRSALVPLPAQIAAAGDIVITIGGRSHRDRTICRCH